MGRRPSSAAGATSPVGKSLLLTGLEITFNEIHTFSVPQRGRRKVEHVPIPELFLCFPS